RQLDLTERQRDLANDCIKIENERAVEAERQLADLKAEYAECERLNDTYEEKALRYAEQLAEAQQRIAELEARKPSPPIGTLVDCLVCGRIQPWGIWHEPTGVAVCVVCRDKAREL